MKLALSLALAALIGSAQAGLPRETEKSLDTVSPSALASSEIASIREAYDAARHAFRASDAGHEARNPGQRWLARFDGRGFTAHPDGGAWEWGLELRSYGFPGSERAYSGAAAVVPNGKRLTYAWDATLQEWFINDARGLEHGFTVLKRPRLSRPEAAADESPLLAFTLAVRGGLSPRVAAGGQGVEFRDGRGALALDYAGLKVWDADGAILPARFEQAESGLRLLVDERGARYPLTIDPIAQQAALKASNLGEGDHFGLAVAISGDTVVVGAPEEDGASAGVDGESNEDAVASGAAYVFVREGFEWVQQAYLKASNPGVSDFFGSAVAISGDTIVVGAPEEDGGSPGVNGAQNETGPGSGAAYVFVRNGTAWTQQAYLKGGVIGNGNEFGYSVAIDGDTILVGAPDEDGTARVVNGPFANGDTQSGAGYVFVRSGTTWTQQAYLKNLYTDAQQRMGFSVSLSGNTAVLGAYAESGGGSGINTIPTDFQTVSETGAAFVFVRNGATWAQQAYIKANPAGATDRFGYSVGISGDTLVVGAPQEDSSTQGVNTVQNDDALNAGAAYVFFRSGTTWTQQAYLKTSNAEADEYVGRAVAISGNTIVLGSYREDSGTEGVNTIPDESVRDAGAAYTFARDGSTWAQREYLKPNNNGQFYEFGYSVGISGEAIVVGQRQFGVGPGSPDKEGAAYVFGDLLPLHAWRQNHFGTIEDAGDAANEFDFDDDSWANLLEYGIVSDPKESESGALSVGPATYGGGEYLRAVFTRDPARSDVTIRVEASGNLAGPWTTVASSLNGAATSGAGLVSETDLAGGLKRVEARDTTAYTSVGGPTRFLRVVVDE